MYRIVGVRPGDRLFFPFSFGPFLGFWTAFEAATRLGYLCLPGGGMSSAARLRFLLDNAGHGRAVYADLRPAPGRGRRRGRHRPGPARPVRALIVAGEPGGSIPATRARIEAGWGARVFDHNGMTEIGPVGIECPENPGGHMYWRATTSPRSSTRDGRAGAAGTGGRIGADQPWAAGAVRCCATAPATWCASIRGRVRAAGAFVRLDGGILGRTDDMIHVRGNNVYPSALETVIRRFPEVAEYRVEVDQSGPLAALRIEVEPVATASRRDMAERIGRAIRDELLFRAEVTAVAPGTLPRFEMKARTDARLR